ncbi:MAG: hypothetical protein ACRCZS_13320 [Chroococcidiopsis sp.]
MVDEDEKFTPKGEPIPLERLTDYTDNGEVVIRRSDVEKAIALSDEEIKKYLQAGQRKK